MKHIDELIYDAIKADQPLLTLIGSRVVSTCFEVPQDQEDNTPLPNVVIIDEGFQNNINSKECVWEGGQDSVAATVLISGESPEEVKLIIRKIRKAVEVHMASLGADMPELNSLHATTLQWDDWKPCYYQSLVYQCTAKADIDD